jgi:hypothetical protein
MESVRLRCGCEVSEEGKFNVGERCENCVECNTISKLHPFGAKRLE